MLRYSIKMRERGDSFTAMMRYLELNCNDEALVKEIAREVDAMEKSGAIHISEPVEPPASGRDIIMGFLCLGAGAYLFFRFWGLGWIVGLPIALVGLGVLSLLRAIR